MSLDNNVQYENLNYIVAKTNLSVKHANWFFQMIVPKMPVTQLPEFNFEYSLCDCSKYQNFTKGTTWERILNNDKPVVFNNTQVMFKEFEDVHKKELGYEKPGAAAFAQYFYQFYRDRFWNGDFTKLIFFVTDKDITDIFQHVDSGGFASPFCTPWLMDNEDLEKSSNPSNEETLTK